MDAEAPLTWRMQKDRAGSGALGDIGAHAVDLTEYITGQRVDERLGHHRDARRRAPAARRGRRPVGHRVDRARRRSPSTTSRCSPDASTSAARAGVVRGDALPHRPQERAAHRDLGLARRRSRSTSSASTNSTSTTRRCPRPNWASADPRDRARPPVPRAVVADRSYARLRAWLLAPGRRLRHGDRRGHAAAARRSRTGCTCSACSMPWSAAPPRAAPGRRPATDARAACIIEPRLTAPEGNTAMTRPITLFTGQWADLPARGGRAPRLGVGL